MAANTQIWHGWPGDYLTAPHHEYVAPIWSDVVTTGTSFPPPTTPLGNVYVGGGNVYDGGGSNIFSRTVTTTSDGNEYLTVWAEPGIGYLPTISDPLQAFLPPSQEEVEKLEEQLNALLCRIVRFKVKEEENKTRQRNNEREQEIEILRIRIERLENENKSYDQLAKEKRLADEAKLLRRIELDL